MTTAAGTARADGPGTPNQPPPDPPPSQPPQVQPQQVQPQPQFQPPSPGQPQLQPAQVPAYRSYQRRRERRSHWYGWQTLIVDGGWIVGGGGLTGTSPAVGAVVVVGGYFLGPPIVHWAHGNVGRGFADLGIRVGAPLLLGVGGYALFNSDRNSNEFAGAAGAAVGAVLGMIGAIVIDAAVLARESDDEDDDDAMGAAPRRSARTPATFAPLIAPRAEGGAIFGLSGTL